MAKTSCRREALLDSLLHRVGRHLCVATIAGSLGCALWGCRSTPESSAASALPTEASGSEGSAANAETVAAVVAPVVEAPPADERSSYDYTIAPGDTLGGIAVRNGCTVNEVRAANPDVVGDTIYAGRSLHIPVCEGGNRARAAVEPGVGQHVVQAGEYLELIASDVGCSVPELKAANNLANDVIYAGQALVIPSCAVAQTGASEGSGVADDGRYRVVAGDYLGLIASRNGCTVVELMQANSLTSDNIAVGQRLTIPQCAGGSLYAGFQDIEQAAPSDDGREAPTRSSDASSLAGLLREHGFRAPSRFKAYIIEVTFNADRSRVVRERRFDYDSTGDDVSGWNPASTVKLYAAIAALQRAESLGFTTAAEITFAGSESYRFTLAELIADAVGPSNNIAYNFLVSFVGYDQINGTFFTRRNGLGTSGVRRAYESSRWMEMGFSSSFAASPAITIREGGGVRELPASSGSVETSCHAAACTSVRELAEAMRRLMLQEQLPSSETFGLSAENLRFLRQQLRSDRSRGEEVVSALGRANFSANSRFYHKAGFAGDWYSDNVYIFDPATQQAWIVALAGYPGRSSLTSAAEAIGEIIADGELARID
jgi:LysM repeat protein